METEISESTELVLAGPFNAMEVFTRGKLESTIGHIRKKVEDFKPDVSTAKGRKAIKSFAYSITKTKTLGHVGSDHIAIQ